MLAGIFTLIKINVPIENIKRLSFVFYFVWCLPLVNVKKEKKVFPSFQNDKPGDFIKKLGIHQEADTNFGHTG